MNTKNDWISVYIYFNEPYYNFLTTNIHPFVKKIVKENKNPQFFFIYYIDRLGEHVRLRFKIEEKAKERVTKQINSAFSAYKIRFSSYRPEIKRYGGPVGIKIAEHMFSASSQAVLSFLADTPNCNYSQALGVAMQLHMAMLSSIGMDKDEAIKFFNHHETDISQDVLEDNCNRQPKSLLQLLSYIWTSCQNGITFDVDWFNKWIADTKFIKDELLVANKKNELTLPNNPLHKNTLWSLYENYVHMTNNRLHISRLDEIQINYNLKKSF